MVQIMLAAACAAGVFLVFLGIYLTLAANPTVEERLRDYVRPVARVGTVVDKSGAPASPIGDRLDKALERRQVGQKLALNLERADVKMTPSEFVSLTFVIVAGCVVLGFGVLRNPPFALMLAAAGFYAPRLWLWRKRAKRLKQFNDQLADGIALLANSLRSGYSLPQAFELLSRDARPPLGPEFARVNREVNLGLTPSDALGNVLNRVPSDDLDLFITAVNVQREVGGNLAEVMDSIADTIRDRVKLMGEVRVLTAQQSYAGYIVTGLPVALAAVMFLINPHYMSTLFQTLLGWIMIGCASAMLFVGFIAMRKIVKIRV